MKNLNQRNKILLGALGAIIAVFALINFSGDLFDGLGGSSSSDVTLTVPEEGATVFVNDRRMQVTAKRNDEVTIRGISSGEHTIIVAKEGFWPWSKTLTFEDGKNFEGIAFLARIESPKTEIAQGTADFADATRRFAAAKLPVEDSELVHASGNVMIWSERNDIFAEWLNDEIEAPTSFCNGSFCTDRQKVLNSTATIRSLDFYKDREDVLLFATGDTIYAIEIDQNGTQNLQPIYEGSNLSFVKIDPNTLYVRDNNRIFRVTL